MQIVNVGYDSTNYYLIGSGKSRLLVDCGWPGTLPKLLANLRRIGVALPHIGFALATHYHPDHAGIMQQLMASGIKLLVLEQQLPGIPLLQSYLKPGVPFVDIDLSEVVRLSESSSRAFLSNMGIAGVIVATPGHSADSVSLVLDTGAAFTGDLTLPAACTEEAREAVVRSWHTIQSLGAKTVYPGHGPVRQIADIVS